MSNKTMLVTLALGAAIALAGPALADKMKAALDGKAQVPPNTSAATGTDPDGVSHDEPGIHAGDRDTGAQAAAAVSGAAADLDCCLWHRPPLAPVERAGDQQVLGGLDAAIAPGID